MYKLFTPFSSRFKIPLKFVSLCTLASRRYFNFSVLNCLSNNLCSTFGKSKLSYIIALKASFLANRFSITSTVIPPLYTTVWGCWRRWAIRDSIICRITKRCQIVYHLSFASNDECFILNCLIMYIRFRKSLLLCFLWFVRFTLYLGL